MGAGQVQQLLQLVNRKIGWSRSDAASKGDGRALDGIIESEIIPRLMFAHRTPFIVARARRAERNAVTIAETDIDQLARASIDLEAHLLLRQVEQWLSRGVAVDSIMLDLLGPAARRLGEYWENDLCDFVDVTMGLWRLQEIVHALAAEVPGRGISADPLRRVLLAHAPGEQHGFGLVLVEEFFRRAGWSTMMLSGDAGLHDIAGMLRAQAFDAIGLTVATDSHIDDLPDAIGVLRAASRNQAILVMLGGRVFADDPDLAIRLGADFTARDARGAVAAAEHMVTARGAETTVPN